jgi:hypothetical protein
MLNDTILFNTFSQHILDSYLNDLIRMICSIVDKNFSNDYDQNKKPIEFISQWLLLIDDNDYKSLETCSNKYIWRLAHVHTSLEYEQNDLLSVYSACRIIDRLEQNQPSHNDELKENQLLYYIDALKENKLTRSDALQKLFGLMFNHLWNHLCKVCLKNDDSQQWIHIYNFISTYYPSNKILDVVQFERNEKTQMEFINLAYLIFLNEKTPEPKKLISNLLNQTKLIHENNDERLDWHEMLPNIIDSIQEYFENKNGDVSTLIIDLSQWIISTLKMSIRTCEKKINFLLKYLNRSTCRLSLSMKQFLFDELMDLSLDIIQFNQEKKEFDCIDRIKLLIPVIFECISYEEIDQNYRLPLPYHPSVVLSNNQPMQRQILLDLFFFHVKRHSTNEIIACKLINKLLLLSSAPKIKNKNLKTIAENYFKQLHAYFSIEWMALFVCETDSNEKNSDRFKSIMRQTIINYLFFHQQLVEFNPNLQLFLSIIISKRSWNYLLNLLQSDHIKYCNNEWANGLYNALNTEQVFRHTKYLEQCHQIQFTLSIKNSLSIFPKLHQPYDELSKIIDKCVQDDLQEQKWTLLSDWIESKQNADPCNLTLKEIKVMILLKIYYDYYCNNQLALLDQLLELIQNILEPSSEEFRVFRVLLQPEQYMIGYPNEDEPDDDNFLNKLFKLDCKDEDELGIRHSLVNLMAMILMGGEQNFLWTFAFQPLTLETTYGEC